MISEVQTFQTPDGKLFATREAAMAHAMRDQFSERAKKFVASHTWARGQDTRALNLVVDFLAFEAVNNPA
jgi:hypothetical protein